jgi:predicted RNA-binding Zn-ribbon protein involved in translation (DUF1610 family)
MRTTQITIWLVLVLGLLACGGKKTAEKQTSQEVQGVATHEMSESIKGDKAMYYTCPMETHKHIHSQEAGKCPECGMELVAVIEADESNKDFYGCPMPMHSHVRSDQPGKCDECGMDLMPMRLKKS